ncbi:hypothetical protein BRADI_2g46785v3 [Brachypodium distachyon]|uniref:Uncharacterized protein n=1 Tax=Brachypodium distachyon TaxID=15368 RepID=A0A2K2DE90_BRADI|nr:hypothetical protein BRADI_2g46785v3 [Brachypodium distachyon]
MDRGCRFFRIGGSGESFFFTGSFCLFLIRSGRFRSLLAVGDYMQSASSELGFVSQWRGRGCRRVVDEGGQRRFTLGLKYCPPDVSSY